MTLLLVILFHNHHPLFIHLNTASCHVAVFLSAITLHDWCSVLESLTPWRAEVEKVGSMEHWSIAPRGKWTKTFLVEGFRPILSHEKCYLFEVGPMKNRIISFVVNKKCKSLCKIIVAYLKTTRWNIWKISSLEKYENNEIYNAYSSTEQNYSVKCQSEEQAEAEVVPSSSLVEVEIEVGGGRVGGWSNWE